MRECRLTIALLVAVLLLGGCKSTKLTPRDETTCLKVQVYGCRDCDSHSAPLSGVTVMVDSSGTVSEKATDTEGNVCFSVKTGTTADILVTSGEGIAGNRLQVLTDTVARDPADCTNCPLVTVTHPVSAGIETDLSADSEDWCASNGWNGNEFGNAWLSDPGHVGFSAAGLTLTLNDKDDNGSPCVAKGDNCKGAQWASGEYKTDCFHGYGTYEATITPLPWSDSNANSGMVIGFFTYTHPEHDDGTVGENNTFGWDEVDVEVLGRWPIAGDRDTPDETCADTSLVLHTNYIAKGVGQDGEHEENYCLPYGTYKYSFTWGEASIMWKATNIASGAVYELRTAPRGTDAWPTQPGRVFLNFWANTTGADWIGPFEYPGERQAVITDVTVP